MTTGPGATSPDSAGKPIAPRAMEPSIQQLLLEAEREAQRLSSYARMAMALVLAIGFVVLIEQSASPLMVVSALGAMACYFVIGFISLLLSGSRVFRPWLAGSLTALDMSVYAFALLGVLRAVDLPPSQFEAVPPFLLVFVLITLSGLRYTPVGVAIVLSVGTLVGLSVLLAGWEGWLAGWWDAPGLQGSPILFASGANLMRLALVAITALLTVVTVQRSRKLLIRAIEMTQHTSNLSRYLPRRIADMLVAQGLAALSRGHTQQAAILFADVRGFTALSERMEPAAISRMMTELRGIQGQVVEDHGGVIDKFIGDCAMAVFGVPEPGPIDAANAVTAALAMLKAVSAWNTRRVGEGLPSINLGIGIHYGEVFAGAVGDETRLEFTILGDSVNVAERVERLSRQLDSSLVITDAVLEAANVERDDWEAMPPMAIKGRTAVVRIFRLRKDIDKFAEPEPGDEEERI